MAASINTIEKDGDYVMIPTESVASVTPSWEEYVQHILSGMQYFTGSRPPLSTVQVVYYIEKNYGKIRPLAHVFNSCIGVGSRRIEEALEFVQIKLQEDPLSIKPITLHFATISPGLFPQRHHVGLVIDRASSTVYILDGKGYNPDTLMICDDLIKKTPSAISLKGVIDAILLKIVGDQELENWQIIRTSNIQRVNDCTITAISLTYLVIEALIQKNKERVNLSTIQTDLLNNYNAVIEEIRELAQYHRISTNS